VICPEAPYVPVVVYWPVEPLVESRGRNATAGIRMYDLLEVP